MNKQLLKLFVINLVIFTLLIIGINIYKADSANLKNVPPYGTDITQNMITLNNIDQLTLDKNKQSVITSTVNNYFIKYISNTSYFYNVDSDSIYQTLPNENGIETLTFNIKSLDNKELYSVTSEISGNNWIKTTVNQVGTNNTLTTFRSLN